MGKAIECKSKEGLKVGLIDSIGYISDTLKSMGIETKETREALIDLGDNESFKQILKSIEKATNEKK